MDNPQKVLAFAASNSSRSINKLLVSHAATLLEHAEVNVIDLNDFEMPLFSVDREDELGELPQAKAFLAHIAAADALLISFAEHNSSYTVAYKNLFDWSSRINAKVYQQKPMVLLSTSPGRRGGASVMASALASIPHQGGEILGHLSIPQFNDAFDRERGELTDPALQATLRETVQLLQQQVQ